LPPRGVLSNEVTRYTLVKPESVFREDIFEALAMIALEFDCLFSDRATTSKGGFEF
jgi:hypothetical protein